VINTVVKLNRDFKATAGQFLVLRSDGNVLAVDADMLDLVLQAGVPEQDPEPVGKALSRREAINKAREMIIAGSKTRDIRKATGLVNATIYRHRNILAIEGLVVRKRDKNLSGHRFYKTPEALEQARQRGKKANFKKDAV
jgi:hypothetical protein